MIQNTHGPYKVLNTKSIYQNKWLNVREDKVIHPEGGQGIFGVVIMKPGATVLALDDQNQVYLVKEYKYAVERDSIELMSGGLDDGEPPLDGAKREMKEELGITATDWTDLGVVDPFTTVINSPNYMFLARNLKGGKQELDDSEQLEILKISFHKVVNMVMQNEITHSASCVCILKAASFLQQETD